MYYYYYCTVYFIHCCFVYNRCKVLSVNLQLYYSGFETYQYYAYLSMSVFSCFHFLSLCLPPPILSRLLSVFSLITLSNVITIIYFIINFHHFFSLISFFTSILQLELLSFAPFLLLCLNFLFVNITTHLSYWLLTVKVRPAISIVQVLGQKTT